MLRKACVVLGRLLLAQVAAAQYTQQGSKLVGTGAGEQANNQGGSVAISADGNTAIVGGGYVYDDTSDGGAWIYTRSDGVWSQQGEKLLGSGAAGQALQGFSVAISGDGNTVILGGMYDNGGTGAAWVFTRAGGLWSQQGGKLVGTGAVAGAVGRSVAISADGNTAIVTGASANPGPTAALVFTRTGGVWTQQGKALLGSRGVCSGQCFGWSSVAISADGNTAIVGWDADDDFVGAAWIFMRSNGVWSQQGGKLVGTGAVGPAHQGASVALSADGSTAIVGGSWDNSGAGATWVFTRTGGEWSQQGDKLVATGAIGPAGQGGSVAVSADGGTVMIGASWDDSGAGATWVFTRVGGVWMQQSDKLVATGANGPARQGSSVAISADGSTSMVGGPGDDSWKGAAWAFSARVRTGIWIPTAAHTAGLNGSHWRSDLGLLNPGGSDANVEVRFFGGAGVVSNTVQVPAGAQSILTDVVGQLGTEGQGAIEVSADQTLKVTSRTYSLAPPDAACAPGGTQGQSYPVLDAGAGLSAGQSAYLPGLVQNAAYRSDIGVLSTDLGGAAALIELFDGAGGKLAEYTVAVAQGQWAQENQPFEKKAGQTALDRGYARITVQSGSGVYAFASVIDNLTNDPTTVAMQR